MPVLDGSFEAFVTNLGKYNEGELVGEWVHFPTTEEEMKKVFERIGIGSKDEFGQVYEEWFITDYDCSIHGVSNLLGEYENLDKLNYLAARLDEMSRSELEHFVAGYTSALKAPVRCFGNHLSGKRKSRFRTDNECGGAAILKTRTSRMGTPVGC